MTSTGSIDSTDEFSDDAFVDEEEEGSYVQVPPSESVGLRGSQQAVTAISNLAYNSVSTDTIAKRAVKHDDDEINEMDGFDLDEEEQAQLDLEHDQVYSAESAFKSIDADQEEADENAMIDVLQDVLKRNQANNSFEYAQSALLTVDEEKLEKQLQVEANLRQSITSRKPKKFATLRKKLLPGSDDNASGESTPTKQERDAQLASIHEENKLRKDVAKKKMMAQFKADLAEAAKTIEVPTELSQVADWDLNDVQGWLSSIVPRTNFSKWCDVAESNGWTGAVLLAVNKATLAECCREYYTISSDIPTVHKGIKILKREGARQGKRTLRRMLSDAVRIIK